ncbi:MAG: S8 family serine peptidase [Brevinematia bacterium]
MVWLVFVFLFFSSYIYSSNLSTEVLNLLESYKNISSTLELNSLGPYKSSIQGSYANLIVDIRGEVDPYLSKYIVKQFPGSSFYIMKVPINEIVNFKNYPSIKYVGLSKKLKPFMDKVRSSIGIEEILNYYGQNTVQGDGVIVGVVDSGIDASHDDFKTYLGKTKILYLWDQVSSRGNPPSGFNYGSEYSREDINKDFSLSTDYEGHGTHVSGIILGNGKESIGKYKGISLGSDLVFVKTDFSLTSVLDGINYIMNKAKNLNKPCVINLSLGANIGSHDGKDIEGLILKDIINYYGKNGHVIVASAGNSGSDKIHFSNTINSVGVSAVIKVLTNSSSTLDMLVADFWINYGGDIQLEINSPSGYTTGWLSLYDGYSQSFTTVDGFFTVSFVSNIYNGDLNLQIQFTDKSGSPINQGNWNINLKSSSGTYLVHGWLDHSDGLLAYYFNGDNSYSVSSPFLVDDVIVVSAYTSRDTVNGLRFSYLTNDNICFFSSKGPTRDGRQKPDISAPGAYVFAPLSSQFLANGFLDFNGNYIAQMGTSMSAPVVSGVVSLLLSINPSFTSYDILNYLKTYADISIYDVNGKLWDESWGWGKVNIQKVVESLKKPETLVWFSGNVIRLDSFNNSTQLNIRLNSFSDTVNISIYNMEGSLVKNIGTFQLSDGLNKIPIFVDNWFGTGVYLVKIWGNNINTSLKLVVIR